MSWKSTYAKGQYDWVILVLRMQLFMFNNMNVKKQIIYHSESIESMIYINAPNNDSEVVCADVANILFSGWNEKLVVLSYKMKTISFTIDYPFHLNVKSAPWTDLTVSPMMISNLGRKKKCHRTQSVCGGLAENERREFLISSVVCNMSLAAALLLTL